MELNFDKHYDLQIHQELLTSIFKQGKDRSIMTGRDRDADSFVKTSALRFGRWGRVLPAIILIIVTVAVFWPVLDYQFLAWDDSDLVYENPYLRSISLENLLRFWRYPYQDLYTPLTYTLYAFVAWAPALITGKAAEGIIPNPQLFHGLNLILHLLSVLTVWLILNRLLNRLRHAETESRTVAGALPLVWAACAGALLFAIHPIQVEPVAWVGGMKDLLFGLLSLVALWQYLQYIDAKPIPERSGRAGLHYGLATGAFILALFAKPTAVVVPLIAWLLAAWAWRLSWREQLSGLGVWFIIALAWGLLTRWVQPASNLDFESPLWARPLIAGDALTYYLYKIVLPLRFGPDYGRTPEYVLSHGWLYITGLVPLVVFVWIWMKRKRMPWPATAAGIFVVVLLPVLGFIPFEFQRLSTVADRYVYLAMLGTALALAWILVRFKKRIAVIGSVMLLVFFVVRSFFQIPYWQNTEIFFKHALNINPNSFVAHHNLGFELAKQGQDAEAISHLTEALRLKPEFPAAYLNLANALARRGEIEEAIRHYNEALRIVPNFARAHTNLGLALAEQRRYEEAIEHHREALRIEPGFAEAHNNLATELVRQGEFDEAMQHFAEALRLNPGYAKAHTNLGIALANQKRFDEAQHHLSKALLLEPNSARAHANMAGLLLQQMKLSEAEHHFTEAVRLDPGYVNARLRLSTVLAAQGKFDQAKHQVSEVLRMNPDHRAARQILERIEYLDRSSN